MGPPVGHVSPPAAVVVVHVAEADLAVEHPRGALDVFALPEQRAPLLTVVKVVRHSQVVPNLMCHSLQNEIRPADCV